MIILTKELQITRFTAFQKIFPQQICPPLSIQVALFVITNFEKESLKMYFPSKGCQSEIRK